jgi:hypothetical protein
MFNACTSNIMYELGNIICSLLGNSETFSKTLSLLYTYHIITATVQYIACLIAVVLTVAVIVFTLDSYSQRVTCLYCLCSFLCWVLFKHGVLICVKCCLWDSLCGLVVRVSGYRSRGLGSIPGTTRFSEK